MAPPRYLDSVNYASVQVKSANVYVNDTNVPVAYLFNLATPFRADGHDIVITTEAGALVPRTISAVGDGTYIIHYRDPAQTVAGGGTKLYVQWGGETVNVANNLATWQNCHGSTDDYVLVVHGEDSAANLTDESGNYIATDTNITYAQTGKILKAPRFNGSDSASNFGNITEESNASKLTHLFWMNQNVLDVTGFIYRRRISSGNNVMFYPFSGGTFRVFISNGGLTFGYFDYSAVVSAGVWAHFAISYNGAATTNADKLCVYVDSVKQTLSFSGSIPASTPDLSLANSVIGTPVGTDAFDGELDEYRIFTGALSENQIKTQYDNQNLFATNGSLNISGASNFEVILPKIIKSSINIGIGF